jgi:CheY-like chemotaxis protein
MVDFLSPPLYPKQNKNFLTMNETLSNKQVKEVTVPKFELVMLIDDADVDLYIASRNINKHHFAEELIEFNSGGEALKYLQDNQENALELPGVIFLDLYMHKMDGFEFMEEYKKLSPLLKEHCQLYILSSTVDPHEINRLRGNSNIIDVFEKPLTRNYLEKIKKKHPSKMKDFTPADASQNASEPKEKVTVRLNDETIIIVNNSEALTQWLERFPNARIIQ